MPPMESEPLLWAQVPVPAPSCARSRIARVFGALRGEVEIPHRRLDGAGFLRFRPAPAADLRGPRRAAKWERLPVKHVVGAGRVVVEVDLLRVLLSEDAGGELASRELDGAESLVGAPIRPLSNVEVQRRTALFGENRVPVRIDGFLVLFARVVLGPFFLFQLASVVLWVLEDYVFYAAMILLTSITSAATEARQLHSNASRMRALADYSTGRSVKVYRKEAISWVSVEHLVPGDLVEIQHRAPVPADLVLLPSEHCGLHYRLLVDESALTGESNPTSRTPYPLDQIETSTFSPLTSSAARKMADSKRHQILAGTQVVAGPNDKLVLGVVLRTAASTRRGSLVRRIVGDDNRTSSSKLETDAYAAMASFLGFGILAMVLVLPRLINFFGMNWSSALLDSLDLITIAVPPALPATVTFGLVFAISRLHLVGIQCLQPMAVARAAQLRAICFDKTGTLTQQGLNLSLMHLYSAHGDHRIVDIQNGNEPDLPMPVSRVMAACHELALDDKNGLMGDPADTTLFEWSQWQPEAAKSDSGYYKFRRYHERMETIHAYEFHADLARMTVVTIDQDGVYRVLSKGSPEVIAALAMPETLPCEFAEVVASYAARGFRVLALAEKSIGNEFRNRDLTTDRGLIEKDLNFLGLAVFENRLRLRTREAVSALRNDARLSCVMATGDRLDTALSVAKRSGIISEKDGALWQGTRSVSLDAVEFSGPAGQKADLVEMLKWLQCKPSIVLSLTGDAFQHLRRVLDINEVSSITQACAVFARMLPEDKTDLVKEMSRIKGDESIGMCGDGANDIGALREAAVGISLCETRNSDSTASLAAGLSASSGTVYSVVNAVIEGRAAASASIAAFQFMFTYSVIQLTSVVLLYIFGNTYGDGQFLFVDLFLVIPLGVLMGRSAAADSLTSERPPTRLLDASVLSETIGQCSIMVLFQLALTFGLFSVTVDEKVSSAVRINDHLLTTSNRNSATFLLCNFQYLLACLIYNVGPPFRSRAITNLSFMVVVGVSFFWCTSLMFWNGGDLVGTWLELAVAGRDRLAIAVLMMGNCLASAALSMVIRKVPLYTCGKEAKTLPD